MPDHAGHGVAAFDVGFQGPILAAKLELAQDAPHRHDHLVVVERFGDVIDGTLLHRIDGGANARVAGHDEYRHLRDQADGLGAGRAG